MSELIVPKELNMENLGINREVVIHNMDEAIAVYQSGEIFAKIGDERRGSALAWVKKNKPKEYDKFLVSMRIKKDAANKLISYSRLVEIAKEKGVDYPKSASLAKTIKGSPEKKLEKYNKAKEELGKEPTRNELSNLKPNLKNTRGLFKETLKNDTEVIDVEPEDEDDTPNTKWDRVTSGKTYDALTEEEKEEIQSLHETLIDMRNRMQVIEKGIQAIYPHYDICSYVFNY